VLDHSGAVFRHGLPEDHVEWTLDPDSRATSPEHAKRGSGERDGACSNAVNVARCGLVAWPAPGAASCRSVRPNSSPPLPANSAWSRAAAEPRMSITRHKRGPRGTGCLGRSAWSGGISPVGSPTNTRTNLACFRHGARHQSPFHHRPRFCPGCDLEILPTLSGFLNEQIFAP
jgi:hypothetical protein